MFLHVILAFPYFTFMSFLLQYTYLFFCLIFSFLSLYLICNNYCLIEWLVYFSVEWKSTCRRPARYLNSAVTSVPTRRGLLYISSNFSAFLYYIDTIIIKNNYRELNGAYIDSIYFTRNINTTKDDFDEQSAVSKF